MRHVPHHALVVSHVFPCEIYLSYLHCPLEVIGLMGSDPDPAMEWNPWYRELQFTNPFFGPNRKYFVDIIRVGLKPIWFGLTKVKTGFLRKMVRLQAVLGGFEDRV
ncbi:hypothetical protein R6Q59_036825 [Mikania micrantha]